MRLASRIRSAFAVLTGAPGAYAAARQPPGRAPWQPPRGGANNAVGGGGATVAARARDAVRNNAYAARIVDLWTANLIGEGIKTQWDSPAHDRVWATWAANTDCDAENVTNWPGLQALAVRAMVESGEALIWLREAPRSEQNPVGLRLQVIESDHLDWTHTGILAGGARVTHGIETDATGRPVAYHIIPNLHDWPHTARLVTDRVRVPASDIVHVYRRRRPGQMRDVSWLAPVLWTMRDLGEYEQALLRKAYVEACLALVVTGSGDDDATLTGDVLTDAHGQRVEAIEPQQILYGRGERKVETVAPSGGGSHQGYAKRALEAVAVGAGLTYDQVSGDLSQANYSSLRAGKIEFRRLCEQMQTSLLIPQLVGRVARRFHAQGAEAGLWGPRMPEVTHTQPAHEMIDPLKDTLAMVAMVRAGVMTQQDAAAALGYSWREIVAAIRRANADCDAAGIILDTDPRRVAKTGGAQDAAQNAAIEIAATGAAAPAAT